MPHRLQVIMRVVAALPQPTQDLVIEQMENIIHLHSFAMSESPETFPFAGIWSDLPDDMEETLLNMRRQSTPTPFHEASVDVS